MTPDSGSPQNMHHGREAGTPVDQALFQRLTITFGALGAATSIIGLLSAAVGISLTGTINNKMIAFSAALLWIFLGVLLAYLSVRPLKWLTGLFLQFFLLIVAAGSAFEFFFSVQGSHFVTESLFVRAGTAILGPSSSPISPVAAALAVTAAIATLLFIRGSGKVERPLRGRHAVSILGAAISLVSFTFVLSYVYGNPLLYGTSYIPIAFLSALAAFFIGLTLIAAAGPLAFPIRYMIGNSTRARLLREFVPLVAAVALVENIVFVGLSSWFNVRDAVLLSTIIVVFILATAGVVSRVSGKIGSALDKAETELVRKNEDLGAMNEELTATQEELRQTNDDLIGHERSLMEKNDELNVLNEELTATQEELRQNLDELTNAEKGLRESEERFRTIAEISPVQLSIARKSDGGLLYSNPEYDRAFGFAPGEFTGHKTPDLYFDPADRERVLGIFRDNGYVENYEVRVKRKDGTPFWINVSLRAVRFLNTDAILAASIDLSDRKRAESTLIRQAELIDLSPDAVMVRDPRGIISFWSKGAESLYGWTGNDSVGQQSHALLGTVFPQPLEEIEQLLTREGRWSGELVHTCRDGRKVIVQSRWVMREGPDQRKEILESNVDITARKNAEEETKKLYANVQEEKDRLSALVGSIRDEIWFADTQKRFTLANPAALKEFGVTSIAEQDVEEFTKSLEVYRANGTPRPVEEAPPLRALMGEVVRNDVELVRTPRTGELRYRQVSASPVRDAGGNIIGSVSVARDITENKKAEEELKRRHEDLNAAYEEITATQEELRQNIDELTQREHDLNKALVEKEVLLSEIHHRVKNNLTAFISLLSLEGSTEDSPAGKLLKQDLQNRARSMALVHETLYRTNMYDEVDMELYLTTLTDQVANSFQTTRSVKTVVDAHGVMLDIPRATPAGLIINELITNSFKYAFPESFDSHTERDAPPTITISLSKDSGMYDLTFRDNGIGLPEGLDITTTKSLGLKLVNFLARHQLRAKIDVHVACGTEFVFRFKA